MITLAKPALDVGLYTDRAESQIRLEPRAVAGDPVQMSRGYAYLTIQVHDVVAAHAHVVANGGTEGMAPLRIGDLAHVSFVRDPDGNWIELSQRASLAGSLD